MSWVLWALVLMSYEASTSLLSRACNSGSLWFHGIASIISNSLYQARYLWLLKSGLQAVEEQSLTSAIWPNGVFFVLCCCAGSVFGHWISATYLERGRRRVGARL